MLQEASVSPVPVAAPVVTVPTPVERMPSPLPIVDSEILASIPLPPEESFDNSFPPQNDISPSEPTSETSSVSPSAESEDKENVAEDASKIVLKYSYKEGRCILLFNFLLLFNLICNFIKLVFIIVIFIKIKEDHCNCFILVILTHLFEYAICLMLNMFVK